MTFYAHTVKPSINNIGPWTIEVDGFFRYHHLDPKGENRDDRLSSTYIRRTLPH